MKPRTSAAKQNKKVGYKERGKRLTTSRYAKSQNELADRYAQWKARRENAEGHEV